LRLCRRLLGDHLGAALGVIVATSRLANRNIVSELPAAPGGELPVSSLQHLQHSESLLRRLFCSSSIQLRTSLDRQSKILGYRRCRVTGTISLQSQTSPVVVQDIRRSRYPLDPVESLRGRHQSPRGLSFVRRKKADRRSSYRAGGFTMQVMAPC
jgi:hypothetical protein